jgi:valyl-tRNA synthetase
MRLGICSRSGDVLEPMITPQWYVNCNGMAQRAVDAVRNKELKIIPAEHEKTWFQWLENIRDWCVSRQLWWGHQIPAWFATKRGETIDKNDAKFSDRWVVARSEEVSKRGNNHLYQHTNVFDRTLWKRLRSYWVVQIAKFLWSEMKTF